MSLLGRRPKITADEAKELAHEQCERHGLPFEEPVRVFREGRYFVVWTKSGWRGGNVIVRVHRRTGTVGDPTVAPR
jgi:hypothetical protein